MKPRKPKANEPSLRDKLSANFMVAFEADFAANGVSVIEQLRLRAPDKYAALAAELIRQAEPPRRAFSEAKSMEDIGRGLLAQVGLSDPSEQQIQMAIAANDRLVSELEAIRAMHVAMEVTEYEERSLRS